ncbi:hypothetical protein IMZ48_35865, partial [Candidatus Bathyarchaeota archaeon]|nr:hypothetical protein [Candidatus Bathyarchaeota archaeon]
MATPTHQSCPACDCDDSALSVFANVLGILTFALGVVAYMVAFTAVTRGAANDIQDTSASLGMTSQHLEQTRRFFDDLQNEGDPDLDMMYQLM